MNAETKIEQSVTFSLSPRVIEAARLCAAKNDVRYYLNGIRVSATRVSATNGHHLYDHTLRESLNIEGEYILAIKRSAPAAALTAIIEVRGSIATVSYYRLPGELLPLMVEVVGVVDGKFPDVDKVLPKDTDEPAACKKIAFNAMYLALAAKVGAVVMESKFPIMQLRVTDANSAAWCEFKDPMSGLHKFVLMPARI